MSTYTQLTQEERYLIHPTDQYLQGSFFFNEYAHIGVIVDRPKVQRNVSSVPSAYGVF
jgi:hypothetical protein